MVEIYSILSTQIGEKLKKKSYKLVVLLCASSFYQRICDNPKLKITNIRFSPNLLTCSQQDSQDSTLCLKFRSLKLLL